MGWILRPRLTFLRIRESLRARRSPPVRTDHDLSSLPNVTVRRVTNPHDFGRLLRLYKRNPSSMNIAPRSQEALRELIKCHTDFYFIVDDIGDHVGNLGYQVDRQMISYLQIDYPYRSQGLALAAVLSIERLLVGQGVTTVYSQIFRHNRRALSTYLSLGWEILEKQSTDEYYTLEKALRTTSTARSTRQDQTS